MRIIIFNSVFFPTKIGGAEQSVYNLAAALVERGYQVAVVSIDRAVKSLVKKKLDNGVVCFYLKDANVYFPFDDSVDVFLGKKITQKALDLYNFRYKKNIIKIFDDFSPDVVHTNNLKGISTIVWSLAKERSYRVVHTLRDYYLQCHRCSKRSRSHNCERTCFGCRTYSFSKKIQSFSVDHVVGISEFILKSHIDDGFFENVDSSVIYNSVSNEKKLIQQSRALRSPPILGYIGRIEEDKGIRVLIDRLSMMHPECFSKIIVAGSGDKEIIRRLKSTSFVDYRGYISPSDFFSLIDYLIVPSLWYEPMGRVVIESFAYGIPVLANKTGGLVELVNDGVTGILTDVANLKEFKVDFTKLMELDYSKASVACINKIDDFTDKVMIEKYIKAYNGGVNK